jgi:hypothetical protein
MTTLIGGEKYVSFSVPLLKKLGNITPIRTSNQAQNFSQVV